MNTDVVVAQDCWIAGQLAGIRMLERELTYAFKSPTARTRDELRRRVDELNSWLNLVDYALIIRAHPARRSSRRSGRVVAMPIYQADRPLPVA
jgi:hypothetical protein